MDLIIVGESDLGFKTVINGKHWGILYFSEVFREFTQDEKVKGYIKKIREDGKLDLTLQNPKLLRHQTARGVDEQILKMLEGNGGFLTVTDKTPPEEIYAMFGVSKKKYKIALGGLYKRRLIAIEDKGIRLLKNRID